MEEAHVVFQSKYNVKDFLIGRKDSESVYSIAFFKNIYRILIDGDKTLENALKKPEYWQTETIDFNKLNGRNIQHSLRIYGFESFEDFKLSIGSNISPEEINFELARVIAGSRLYKY